jgi:histidinol dehydrogenase
MNPEQIVKSIIGDVRKNGDRAIIKYTNKFDKFDLTSLDIEVPQSSLKEAWDNTSKEIRAALSKAKNNITLFHSKQIPKAWRFNPEKGVSLGQIFIPIENAGLYVPGGTAPLVSSVLMTAIPAKVAGVKNIFLTTPPPVNQHILAAAYLCGVSKVYRVGGAQAIAALAYGTETIQKADIIVGPGNIFVTAAKKLVYGDVNIDMLAGPSEIAVIADKSANPRHIALDLLSQLEHGISSSAVLIAIGEIDIKEAINKELRFLGRKNFISLNNLKVIQANSFEAAIDIVNDIAPEHLELMVKNPRKLIPKIKNAGIVLAGNYTPVALSDFLAGTNHVLPTGRTAKSFAGLTTWNFLKPVSVIEYSKEAINTAKKNIKIFSEIEGLDAHGKSVEVR